MNNHTTEATEEVTQEQVDLVLVEVERSGGHGKKHHPHLVTVTVDTHPKQVRPGRYLVSVFKKAVGVDPARQLDEVVHSELKPLEDNARIVIKGGEVFVSHVRTGGSS